MDKLTEIEYTRLRLVESDQEWDAVCHSIKKAHDGVYPTDWWERVMCDGGPFEQFQARMGRAGEPAITIHGSDGERIG